MKAKTATRRQFVKTAAIISAGSIFTLARNQWLWAAKMVNPEVFRRKTYTGLKALTELPYFEMNARGLLRLTVDGLEGGIDGRIDLISSGPSLFTSSVGHNTINCLKICFLTDI